MKIEHIAIWVTDLDVMKSFYETYFGARSGPLYMNPKKEFTSYFLSFDGDVRLELMHRPMIEKEKKIVDKIGYAHLAISVGSKEKVDEQTEVLRADKYEIVGEPRWTGDGYYESVILDPEMNRIEITI